MAEDNKPKKEVLPITDENQLIQMGNSSFYINGKTKSVYHLDEYGYYNYKGRLDLSNLLCPIDGSDEEPECDEDNPCVDVTVPNRVNEKHRIKYYPLNFENREFADYGELVLDTIDGDIYIRTQDGCGKDSFTSPTQDIREELGGDLYKIKKIISYLEPMFNFRNKNGDRITFKEYVLRLVHGDNVIVNWVGNPIVPKPPVLAKVSKDGITVKVHDDDKKHGAVIVYKDKFYENVLSLDNLTHGAKYVFRSVIPQDNVNYIKESVSETYTYYHV